MSDADVEVAVQGTGFYGKLPSRGDFVQRQLPAAFVETVDAWLQESFVISREQIGDAWLNAYLTSPIWNFILPKSVIDDSVWCGAIMPSVDRVNRYFPLIIAAPLDTNCSPVSLWQHNAAFFSAVENLLIVALDDDELELDTYNAQVQALAPDCPTTRPDTTSSAETDGQIFRFATNSENVGGELQDYWCRTLSDPYSLWWSAAEDQTQLLVLPGLPEPENFTCLLNLEQPSQEAKVIQEEE